MNPLVTMFLSFALFFLGCPPDDSEPLDIMDISEELERAELSDDSMTCIHSDDYCREVNPATCEITPVRQNRICQADGQYDGRCTDSGFCEGTPCECLNGSCCDGCFYLHERTICGYNRWSECSEDGSQVLKFDGQQWCSGASEKCDGFQERHYQNFEDCATQCLEDSSESAVCIEEM